MAAAGGSSQRVHGSISVGFEGIETDVVAGLAAIGVLGQLDPGQVRFKEHAVS